MITSNGTIKNSAKRLLEFEARFKEEIERKYRFGLMLDMINQISKNFHYQDCKDLKISLTGKAKVRKFLNEGSHNPKNVFRGVDTIRPLRNGYKIKVEILDDI